jgi:hypothetical protein
VVAWIFGAVPDASVRSVGDERATSIEEFGSIACRVYSPKRDGRNTRSPIAESTRAQSLGEDELNLRARFATLEEVCSYAFEVIVGLHVLLALALVVFSRCGRIVSNRFEGAIIDRTSATCLSARQRGSVPLDRYAVLREELTVAGSLLRLESAYSQLRRGGRDI